MLLVLVLCFYVCVGDAINLQQLNIDPDGVTTSGISSGGAMAIQLHVALSSKISGAASFAGVPYYCARGSELLVTTCMLLPLLLDADDMVQDAIDFQADGTIDPLSNLADDRVYVFHGTEDPVVNPGVSEVIVEFYSAFMSPDRIETMFNLAAGHGFPTEDYGVSCSLTGVEFINDCDYHGAFESLNALYGGGLVKPQGSVDLLGEWTTFDQAEFFGGAPDDASLAETGFIYIPSGCQEGGNLCKLHIPLHGCLQNEALVGDVYATKTGYLEVGELNDIVMLFPQTISSLFFPTNPQACWDWWSYTDNRYAEKPGEQIEGIRKMIDRLVHGS